MCRVRIRHRNQDQRDNEVDCQDEDLSGTDVSPDSDEETERLRQRCDSKRVKTLAKEYAVKCLDKFVGAMGTILEGADSEIYNKIKTMQQEFGVLDIILEETPHSLEEK